MTRVYISSDIKVHHPNADMLRVFAELLTIDNPDYEKKKRMGKWLGGTPKTFNLYSPGVAVNYSPGG